MFFVFSISALVIVFLHDATPLSTVAAAAIALLRSLCYSLFLTFLKPLFTISGRRRRSIAGTLYVARSYRAPFVS